jgi:hypothetical protein
MYLAGIAAVETMVQEIKQNIDNSIVWDMMKIHHSDWTEVRIPWATGSDGTTPWNEICAWALEEFGLPGERYVTHPEPNQMTYLFRDSKDAVMMTLRWSGAR